jgi:hypothetical protein
MPRTGSQTRSRSSWARWQMVQDEEQQNEQLLRLSNEILELTPDHPHHDLSADRFGSRHRRRRTRPAPRPVRVASPPWPW